jgi:hypothetical protein
MCRDERTARAPGPTAMAAGESRRAPGGQVTGECDRQGRTRRMSVARGGSVAISARLAACTPAPAGTPAPAAAPDTRNVEPSRAPGGSAGASTRAVRPRARALCPPGHCQLPSQGRSSWTTLSTSPGWARTAAATSPRAAGSGSRDHRLRGGRRARLRGSARDRGHIDPDTGALSLSGSAPLADYETALRSVKFRHVGDDPATSRSIEFTANDGDADSNARRRRSISSRRSRWSAVYMNCP